MVLLAMISPHNDFVWIRCKDVMNCVSLVSLTAKIYLYFVKKRAMFFLYSNCSHFPLCERCSFERDERIFASSSCQAPPWKAFLASSLQKALQQPFHYIPSFSKSNPHIYITITIIIAITITYMYMVIYIILEIHFYYLVELSPSNS